MNLNKIIAGSLVAVSTVVSANTLAAVIKTPKVSLQNISVQKNDTPKPNKIPKVNHKVNLAHELDGKCAEFIKSDTKYKPAITDKSYCTGKDLKEKGSWRVYVDKENHYGLAKCSITKGTKNKTGIPSNTKGDECWCRGARVSDSYPYWVYTQKFTSHCSENCTIWCAYQSLNNKEFREAFVIKGNASNMANGATLTGGGMGIGNVGNFTLEQQNTNRPDDNGGGVHDASCGPDGSRCGGNKPGDRDDDRNDVGCTGGGCGDGGSSDGINHDKLINQNKYIIK